MPRSTLLALARRSGVLIGHPCRGEGVCGKCGVRILEGAELLEPASDRELELLRHEGAGEDVRMSCLAALRAPGAITVRVGGGTYRVEVPERLTR